MIVNSCDAMELGGAQNAYIQNRHQDRSFHSHSKDRRHHDRKLADEKGEVSFFSPNKPPAFGCCPQHFTHSDFLFLFKRKSWDYAFTIVRDPYERMESEYFSFADQVAGKFGIGPDFSVWMLEQLTICARSPLHRDNHVRCQLDFVDEGMDIFKYEDGLESIAGHISGLPRIKPQPLNHNWFQRINLFPVRH